MTWERVLEAATSLPAHDIPGNLSMIARGASRRGLKPPGAAHALFAGAQWPIATHCAGDHLDHLPPHPHRPIKSQFRAPKCWSGGLRVCLAIASG